MILYPHNRSMWVNTTGLSVTFCARSMWARDLSVNDRPVSRVTSGMSKSIYSLLGRLLMVVGGVGPTVVSPFSNTLKNPTATAIQFWIQWKNRRKKTNARLLAGVGQITTPLNRQHASDSLGYRARDSAATRASKVPFFNGQFGNRPFGFRHVVVPQPHSGSPTISPPPLS